MRIRMVDKSKANFGNIVNCNAAAAQALIIMGAAEAMPFNGFRERLKAESQNRVAQPGDTPVPVLTPGWSITKRGPRDDLFIQEVTAAGESLIYDPEKGIPAACPAKVKDQYLRLKGTATRNVAEETELAKRKQLDYELSISDAKRY